MPSDTPRTDAECCVGFDGCTNITKVDASFARQLERENAELRAELAQRGEMFLAGECARLRNELARKTKALECDGCAQEVRRDEALHWICSGCRRYPFRQDNWESLQSRPVSDGGPIGQGAARLLGVDIEGSPAGEVGK